MQAGFGVNLRAFTDPGLLWQLLLNSPVAIGSKFVGAFVGARIQRMTFQQSAAIAVLIEHPRSDRAGDPADRQTGRILDTAMFTMMVVMALVTTVITEPLLRIVYPDKAVQRDIDAATKAALGSTSKPTACWSLSTRSPTRRRSACSGWRMRHSQTADLVRSCCRDFWKRPMTPHLSSSVPARCRISRVWLRQWNRQRCATQTTATAATLRVLCRFGSASGQDVIRQAETSGAEAVVVSEAWAQKHPRAYDALDAVTVLVVPAELPAIWLLSTNGAALGVSDDAVYVRDDGAADGARAVLVGVQAATASGRSLIVVVADTDGRARRRLQLALEPLRSTPTRVILVSPSMNMTLWRTPTSRLWPGSLTG